MSSHTPEIRGEKQLINFIYVYILNLARLLVLGNKSVARQYSAAIDCSPALVKKALEEKASIQLFRSEMSLLTRFPTSI